MLKNYQINNKKKAVCKYLQKNYQIDPNTLSNLDQFLENSIEGIVTIKIWREKLKPSTSPVLINYLNEIISNLNQIVILSSCGFVIPSIFLIRRSYENLSAYLYFKDHTVELFIKENDLLTKHRKMDEIESYFENFPLKMYYSKIDESAGKKLLSEIIQLRKVQYGKLSNYVHANNQKYLELIPLINEIKPNNDRLKEINDFIIDFNTIFNAFFIIFSFKIYHSLSPEEKEIIRISINENYKQKIRLLFKEI
jgi:hypothetical protein